MADRFNPITDLQPVDPFNVPVEESSEEVESIRVKLIVTRNKTAELVNILKKKNISFNKDIDTIRELNRRLMRTIPRIPILRGDASTQTNRLEEISRQKGEFDIDTTLMPKPDPKIKQRLLSFAVDLVLFFYGGRLIKPLLKRLGILKLIKPKVLEEAIPDNFKIPIEIPPIKTPKLTPAQIKLNNIRRTLKEAETVIPLRKPRVDRTNFFNLNNKERIIKNSQFTGPQDLFKRTKDELKKLLQREKDLQQIYQNLLKNRDFKSLQKFLKKQVPKDKYDKILNKNNTILNKNNTSIINEGGRKIPKRFQNLKNNSENMTKYGETNQKASIDGPSSNDIAMGLNTDTNTINNIYIVDEDFTIT